MPGTFKESWGAAGALACTCLGALAGPFVTDFGLMTVTGTLQHKLGCRIVNFINKYIIKPCLLLWLGNCEGQDHSNRHVMHSTPACSALLEVASPVPNETEGVREHTGLQSCCHVQDIDSACNALCHFTWQPLSHVRNLMWRVSSLTHVICH